jgi:hypothetical protein
LGLFAVLAGKQAERAEADCRSLRFYRIDAGTEFCAFRADFGQGVE